MLSVSYENGGLRVFSCFVWFRVKNKKATEKSVLNMASSNSQIDKTHRGRPKRAELPDVNKNTGRQSINTGRATLTELLSTGFAFVR